MTRNEIKRFKVFLREYESSKIGCLYLFYHSSLHIGLELNLTEYDKILKYDSEIRYFSKGKYEYVKHIEPYIVKKYKCGLDYFLTSYTNHVNLWVYKPERNQYYSNVKYF
jgi:hypothetical protein